ncbi:heavy metal sensor histidine kinase [Bordetella genomosp. 13]|uniref:Sensor protein n=1 Tax=Bordetella genomosp. 13 TaxID=463040 RepID=A0A1W6ZCC2_9BORD|nr:heavy metal sensor histidine kinase [Bordetella genomosp. 13]ARP95046.1 two-component sensor histidine kinase [Bordetella genomosp. 13]
MKGPHLTSIRRRLTLLLAAIALVVSSVAGYTLFLALKYEVQRREMAEVAGKLDLIDHLIGMQTTLEGLAALTGTLDNILVGHPTLKVWLVDTSGGVLYGDAPPHLIQHMQGRAVLLETVTGTRMRALQVPVRTQAVPDALLTVAIDTQPSAEFLYGFASVLVAICIFWIGASALLAAWAVRRSLAPVHRLSHQAARIQPDHLDLRLPVQGIDRELRELSVAFNSTLDRLQAAYRQLEGFNADVAHELRTPLATLINGTEIVLASDRSNEELRDVLESNLEELVGLKALINDMLFLSRADGGELARDVHELEMQDEIRHVADYHEAALQEARLSLRQAGNARVPANPRLLRRALSNLISNAIKASPAGATLEVACIESLTDVEVRVVNPGAAIPPHALPRIFDRFYRVDDARTHRSEGHGLGLAIVRAIAQMHGGRVFALSEGGRTIIGFTLSRIRPTERLPPQRSERDGANAVARPRS